MKPDSDEGHESDWPAKSLLHRALLVEVARLKFKQKLEKNNGYSRVDNGNQQVNVSNLKFGVGTIIKILLKQLFEGFGHGSLVAFLSLGSIHFVSHILRMRTHFDLSQPFHSHLFSKLLPTPEIISDLRMFVFFCGSFVGIFRFVNALMFFARGNKDDQLNSIIAAIIASPALLIDRQERRRSLAVFLFVRSMDIVIKGLCRKGFLPYFAYAEHFMFGAASTVIMYGFVLEPWILEKTYYNWILRMGNVKDKQLEDIGRVVVRANAKAREIGDMSLCMDFRHCNKGYHDGGCVNYVVSDWFAGLLRAATIYGPVHLLPVILFRIPELTTLDGILLNLRQYLINLAQSSLFLSTYVFIIKANICGWRNLLKRDSPLLYSFAGLQTGLACLFERKSRVSELTLFCWPKTLEAAWRWLASKDMVHDIKYGELPLFAFAVAVMAAANKQDYKKTYFNLVKLVIGRRRTHTRKSSISILEPETVPATHEQNSHDEEVPHDT